MAEIDRLFTEATEALEAIAKFRANERAANAKLANIGATTLRPAETTRDTDFAFYKALTDALPDEDGLFETFQNICSDMDIDEEGNPLEDEDAPSRMSDVEFDYRHAKMGRAYL